MLKKLFVLTLVLSVISQKSFAQEFMHSAGATMSILSGKINSDGYKSSFSMLQTCFAYFPRYNFIEHENSSVSIGAPVDIGIGLANNTYDDDVGVSFAFDLPLVLDYNMGFKSTSEISNYFCGYFGAGFGYYHVSVTGSQYSDLMVQVMARLFVAACALVLPTKAGTARAVQLVCFIKRAWKKISSIPMALTCCTIFN